MGDGLGYWREVRALSVLPRTSISWDAWCVVPIAMTPRSRSQRRFDWTRRQFRFDPDLDALFSLYAETVGLSRGAILRAILLRHLRLVYRHGRTAEDVRESVTGLTPDEARRYVVQVRGDFEKFLGR